MRKTRPWQQWVLGLVAAALLWSCGWLRRAPSTPPPLPTPTNLPSAQEALQEAATQLQTTGQVTLRLHESQATAWVQQALAQQRANEVQEVAVFFRNGRIEIYATVSSALGPLPVELVVTPQVTADGGLAVQVEKATLGGVAMPQSLLNDYLGQLDLALNRWSQTYRIETITIADGWLIAQARRR